MPSLKTGRLDVASCIVGDIIYAFFGINHNKGANQETIEKLDTSTMTAETKKWTRMDMDYKFCRYETSVQIINSNEIVIFGGRQSFGNLSDLIIFDIEEEDLSTAIKAEGS